MYDALENGALPIIMASQADLSHPVGILQQLLVWMPDLEGLMFSNWADAATKMVWLKYTEQGRAEYHLLRQRIFVGYSTMVAASKAAAATALGLSLPLPV